VVDLPPTDRGRPRGVPRRRCGNQGVAAAGSRRDRPRWPAPARGPSL